ncbi:hypothetical protein OIV83_005985 [Microbotryomycetes sp. JL201]|nr:hypothetical protein OIV83_005985 [Microbotryomycetes sp. JL201]
MSASTQEGPAVQATTATSASDKVKAPTTLDAATAQSTSMSTSAAERSTKTDADLDLDDEDELDSNVTESQLFPANGQTTAQGQQDGDSKPDSTKLSKITTHGDSSKDGQRREAAAGSSTHNGDVDAAASDKDGADAPIDKIKQSLDSLPPSEQDVVRRNIEALMSYPPELPLTSSWTLHFSDTSSASKSNHGTTADQYDDAVKKVFDADTVPLLCGNLKAFKKLAKPKRAKDDSLGLTRAGQNLHFFRTGVSPTWEDPWNAKGGRLTISPPAAVFESVYEKLLLLVAGSVLEMQATQAHEENKAKKSEERGQIVGVVASRRARGDRIEVWLGGTDKLQPPNTEWIDKLKESLSEKLGMPELRGGKYKRHFIPPNRNLTMSERVQHHKQDEEIAYRLQVMGAREGAIKGTLISGALMLFANYRFPFVRRQTLAGKAFLTSWGTVFGMVIYADHYLLDWERKHKAESERWRTAARKELSGQGIVPSETSMRKWKANYDAENARKYQQEQEAAAATAALANQSPAANEAVGTATAIPADSAILKELRSSNTDSSQRS